MVSSHTTLAMRRIQPVTAQTPLPKADERLDQIGTPAV